MAGPGAIVRDRRQLDAVVPGPVHPRGAVQANVDDSVPAARKLRPRRWRGVGCYPSTCTVQAAHPRPPQPRLVARFADDEAVKA